MSEKPNGWNDLSLEDRTWASETAGLNWKERCLDSIAQKKPARLTFLMLTQTFPPPEKSASKKAIKIYEDYYNAAKAAVESGDPELVLALMQGKKFALSAYGNSERYVPRFSDVPAYTTTDAQCAKTLFGLAKDNFEVWKVLRELNTPTSCIGYVSRGYVGYEELASFIPYDTDSREVIAFHLEQSNGHIKVFEGFINGAGMKSTETLEFLLTHDKKPKPFWCSINEALTRTVKNKDLEKTKLLLTSGATIDSEHRGALLLRAVKNLDSSHVTLLLENNASANYQDAQSVKAAISEGNMEIFHLLLPHIDIERYANNLLGYANAQKEPAPFAEALKAKLAEIETARRLEEERTREEKSENYSLFNSYTLSRTENNNKTCLNITTLFNFRAGQQTTLVTRFHGINDSPGVAVCSFDDINPEYLEEMREKLVKLGGKPGNTVYTLPKSPLSRKPEK